MSLRDTILAAKDIGERLVEVTEWGVTVLVRGLDGADRARMLDQAFNQDTREIDLYSIYPDMVILCAYDPETGERIFEPDTDRQAILAKSSVAIDKVALVAMELAGFNDKAVDTAGKDS